ncbi:energy transducer TonB [Lutimonas sp.]|uniref:energy transducer TonB n=1 Tax=Lutimonas sp. TaxID=1872403 RepID=UPI003D9B9201
MLAKKSPKAEIGAYSKIFFQLGLLLTLVIIYTAIEWKSFDRTVSELSAMDIQEEEIFDIPITERIQEVKPPPPPPPAPEVIEIVADEQEIEETILESTETDESEYVEVIAMDDIDEVVEEEQVEQDIPFAIIEDPPVYPGCKGTKEQKKKCLQDKITQHISKNYNTGLSQDLGLTPGKKKVYVIFKIDKTGKISDARARGPHKRLEKEALRVVNMLPTLTPGKQRGMPVGVSYTLPITLHVQI